MKHSSPVQCNLKSFWNLLPSFSLSQFWAEKSVLEKNMTGFALFFYFNPSSSTNYEVSSFPGLSLGPGVERQKSYIEQKRFPRTKNICCCCSVTKLCPTLCESTDCQASLSSTISQSLLKLMSIESVMPSNHLILCHPLLPLPSIFPSSRVFSNESALCIRWPKYWSFSFSISPSNEYSGLIFFRIDWFDRFAVQGTLKSPLQHHNSKASMLWHSAFFMVQLSHPYMTTGKTTALIMDVCRQNDVSDF